MEFLISVSRFASIFSQAWFVDCYLGPPFSSILCSAVSELTTQFSNKGSSIMTDTE